MRFGFSCEGDFRQHVAVTGRNRDTAWFAMTGGDWQGIAPAYRTWISQENFDADGISACPARHSDGILQSVFRAHTLTDGRWSRPNSGTNLPQVMGWPIIAFGVTLGAQFWFDLFKRLVNLRTSGQTLTAKLARTGSPAP